MTTLTDIPALYLSPEEWADPGQVILTLSYYDELFSDPSRLSDPAFVAYLLGSMSPESKATRDLFVPVAVLGLNTTISAYLGGLDSELAPEGHGLAPETLDPPPAMVRGLNINYLANKDHAQDQARLVRLLSGGHVGPVDLDRLAVGRCTMLALAAIVVPPGIRSNLLCMASFIQWMEGDTEEAGMNALLASMSDPESRLPQLLTRLYAASTGPLWQAVQRGREEAV